MARFRGIGDDATRVMAEQERERLEQQRINEQVRSNKAQESLRSRELNVRQREADKDRQFRTSMSDREMAFKREQQQSELSFRQGIEEVRRDIDQQRLDMQRQEAKRRAEQNILHQQRTDEMFQMKQDEWNTVKQQQEERMRIAEGSFAVGVRQALFDGFAPPTTIQEINASLGLADTDPNAIRKIYDVRDPDNPFYSFGLAMTVLNEQGEEELRHIPPQAIRSALGNFSQDQQDAIMRDYTEFTRGANSPVGQMFREYDNERKKQLEEAKADARARAQGTSGTTRGGGARGGGGGDDMGAQLKRAQDIRAWIGEIQKRIDDGTASDSDLSLMENLKNTEYHLSQVASRTAQGMTQEDPEAEVMRQVEQKSGLISQYNTAAEQLEELRTEALKIKEVAEKDMKSDIGLSYSEKIGKMKALSATMNDIVAKMNKDRMPAPSAFTDLTREEVNSPSVAGAHDRESPFPKTAVKNAIGGISHIQAHRGSDESGVQIIIDDVKNNKQVAIPVVDIEEPDPNNKDAHKRWENYMKLRMLIGDKEIDYVVAETQRAIMEADAVIAKRAAEGYLEKVGRKQAASSARKEEEKSGTMRKVSARGGL